VETWLFIPKFEHAGLSQRAGGWGFSPATTSLGLGYFDTKTKILQRENTSNYKMN